MNCSILYETVKIVVLVGNKVTIRNDVFIRKIWDCCKAALATTVVKDDWIARSFKNYYFAILQKYNSYLTFNLPGKSDDSDVSVIAAAYDEINPTKNKRKKFD